MQCHMCYNSAVGVCQSCGLAACNRHISSARQGHGPVCAECRQKCRQKDEDRLQDETDRTVMGLYVALQGISLELNKHGVTFELGEMVGGLVPSKNIVFLRKEGEVNVLYSVSTGCFVMGGTEYMEGCGEDWDILGPSRSEIIGLTVENAVKKIADSIILGNKLLVPDVSIIDEEKRQQKYSGRRIGQERQKGFLQSLEEWAGSIFK